MLFNAKMRSRCRINKYSMNNMKGKPMRINGNAMIAESGKMRRAGNNRKWDRVSG